MKTLPVKLPIKAILFDHDDTLVASIKSKWAQHKFIAKTFYDKTLTDADIRRHWGKPFTVLLKLLYETDNIDMAMSYNICTRKDYPKALFEDTLATITGLRNAKIKTGIVTSTTNSSLDNDFKTLGISRQLFDYIQTEDETIFHKPDSRVFEPTLKWLAQQKIKPSEALYIGDSLTDMNAVAGVGIQFLGITRGLTTQKEFEKHGGRAIKKLADLSKLFN